MTALEPDVLHQQLQPVRLELLGSVLFSGLSGERVGLSGLAAGVTARPALHEGVVSTEHLIDTLWWEIPDSGRNALQQHLNRVRRILEQLGGRDAIRTVGRTGYELDRSVVWVDIQSRPPTEVVAALSSWLAATRRDLPRSSLVSKWLGRNCPMQGPWPNYDVIASCGAI